MERPWEVQDGRRFYYPTVSDKVISTVWQLNQLKIIHYKAEVTSSNLLFSFSLESITYKINFTEQLKVYLKLKAIECKSLIPDLHLLVVASAWVVLLVLNDYRSLILFVIREKQPLVYRFFWIRFFCPLLKIGKT